MEHTVNPKKMTITGWVLSGLAILFFLFDVVGKFTVPDAVKKGTVELGYQESSITTLGVLLLISVIFYIIPRTAVIGAILLTGYLGGAVATHVRISNPLFSHVLTPVYFGIFVWAGLALRSVKLRQAIKNPF